VDVAIASEWDAYDGEIYAYLASVITGHTITKWNGGITFNGCRSVAKLAGLFLTNAERAGVQHAILAVDNDGGANGPPQHDVAHVPPPSFVLTDDDVCRECWLNQCVPATWTAGGGKHCIVVPVQAIETWLLAVRGVPFNAPSPEAYYNRRAMKAAFFGKPTPSQATRIQLAINELQKPGAMAVLEARPSFLRFREQLATWP
jgi:hypothetical protein